MRPTAVVTGAASGIGRELVAALQHDAWVAGIDLEAGDETVPAAVQYQADVTKPAAPVGGHVGRRQGTRRP